MSDETKITIGPSPFLADPLRAQEPTPDQLAEKVRRAFSTSPSATNVGEEARAALSELVARLATAEAKADCGGVNCGKCQQCLTVHEYFAKEAITNLRENLAAAETERDQAESLQQQIRNRAERAEKDRDEVTAELAKLLAEFKLQRDERDRLARFAASMSGLIVDMGDVPDPGLDDLPGMAEAIRAKFDGLAAERDSYRRVTGTLHAWWGIEHQVCAGCGKPPSHPIHAVTVYVDTQD